KAPEKPLTGHSPETTPPAPPPPPPKRAVPAAPTAPAPPPPPPPTQIASTQRAQAGGVQLPPEVSTVVSRRVAPWENHRRPVVRSTEKASCQVPPSALTFSLRSSSPTRPSSARPPQPLWNSRDRTSLAPCLLKVKRRSPSPPLSLSSAVHSALF